MANIPTNLFSGRDFSAEFERLLTILRQELPLLSDLNHSDAGVALIRLVAREGDMLSFMTDRVFEEGYIDSARFRQSLVDLARTVGYLPEIYSPASTSVTLTRLAGVTGAIPIPIHSSFFRGDDTEYLTVSGVTMSSGVNSVEIDAIQGTVVNATVSPSEFEITDRSEQPRYNLGTGIAYGSLTMQHGNPAIEWTEVDSFYRSFSEDYNFLIELNGDTGEAWLVVGDGSKGAGLPSEDLSISYVQTVGSTGNGGHSTITRVSDSLKDYVTCTNSIACTGGAEPETTTELRKQIPDVTQTQRRMVICEDYEALLEHIPGVKQVKAMDRNDSDEFPHLYIVLYVLPNGGGEISPYLRQEILSVCNERGHLGDWAGRYIIKPATPLPVNVSCKIGVAKTHVTGDVVTAVETVIANYLSADNMTIGGTLSYSDLHTAISRVPGVSYTQLNNPNDDVFPAITEIVAAGEISVSV
jgi:hypothetical protein